MGVTHSVRQASGVTVVELSGRITLETNAPGSGVTLHELIHDLLKQGHKNILLNFRDVTYLDSSGIGELFGCYTTVRSQGGALKLSNPTERVQNLLRLTMLNTVLGVMENDRIAADSSSKAGAA